MRPPSARVCSPVRFLALIVFRSRWLHLPGAVLVALLERTPAVRVATTAGSALSASPLGAVARSVFTGVASLGAVHALAGATQLSLSRPAPITGTVGTAITPLAIATTGSPTPAESYRITNFPPGLTVAGVNGNGIVNTAVAVISGTPTVAGNFSAQVIVYEFTGAQGDKFGPVNIAFNISNGVTIPPAITAQPASQTVVAGASATFSAGASGTPAPTLQWKRNGGNVSGATTATLTLTNVQSSNEGRYTLVATNPAGTATSDEAVLTVVENVAPAITQQPTAQSVVVGATVTFIASASGTPVPTFQWRRNGASISGATNASLTLSNVQVTDAGDFTFVATNVAGTATSNAATLTVTANPNIAPAISQQPASQTVAAGASVTLSSGASGTPTPTLQWRRNGANVAGATNPALTLANVQPADAGDYTLVATNVAGTATSSAATLAVTTSGNIAPAITLQPVSRTVVPGSSVTFSSAASGTPTPTLQWRRNGGNISGATSAALTLASAQSSDEGAYTLVATNAAGTAISNAATLNVTASANIAPAITQQPVSLTVAVGANVTFSSGASGTPLPTLQWRRNGGSIPGATNATLILTNVQLTDAGSYSLFAINAAGSATSNAAILTLSSNAPPAIVQQPAGQSVAVGANVTFAPAAIGAVPLAFQWQHNGSDVAGATNATLTLENVQPPDAGVYTLVASNALGRAASEAAPLTVNAVDQTARLGNLSVRAALAANQTLIVGVVVQDGTRNILVRAAGPALTAFGLTGAMTDPRLELYSGQTLTFANDDWPAALTATFASVGAFPFTAGSRDAAFMQSLNAAHSIQTRGTGAGVVLVEAYDTGAVTVARMVNVSARNRVGSGDDIMIAGFNIMGSGAKRLLIRAVGPKLSAFGVPGVLGDPKLEIFSNTGVKQMENDNWDVSLAATFVSVGAFALDPGSRDAALIAVLPPGSYTVQVRGADGGTGEALVEIYELP